MGVGEEEVGKMVEDVLERVWVMRVFDWWGVMEAVGEVRAYVHVRREESRDVESGNVKEDVEGSSSKRARMGVDGGVQRAEEEEEEEEEAFSPLSSLSSLPSQTPSPPPLLQTQKETKTEIPDSDAETDEDILISCHAPPAPAHSPELETQSQNILRGEIPGSSDEELSPSPPPALPSVPRPAVGFLIIDTVTHPVTALLSKAHSSSSSYTSPLGVFGIGIGEETVPAGAGAVGGAYALVERFWRELGIWVGREGVGVLVSAFLNKKKIFVSVCVYERELLRWRMQVTLKLLYN